MKKNEKEIFVSHQSGVVIILRGCDMVSFDQFHIDDIQDLLDEYNHALEGVNIKPGTNEVVFCDGLFYHFLWNRKETGFYNTDEGHVEKLKRKS